LAASEYFDVSVEKNLTLLTIRHYNNDSIDKLINGKEILLEQKTTETWQLILR
jgi:aspartate kinase